MSPKTALAGGALFFLAACGDGAANPPPTSPVTAGAATVSVQPGSAQPGSARTVAIPASIPAAAFLQTGDVPGKAKSGPDRLGAGDQPLPKFCDTEYERADRIGVRATQSLAFGSKDAPNEATPKAMTYEDVLVFRGDGAATFMADLREAVKSCASATDGRKNRLLGDLGAGDESAVIEQAAPATAEDGSALDDGSQHYLYWSVVRVADAVAFVSNTGWESGSAQRGDTEQLGRKAAARLAAWRH
jgi:hypothetical protein